MADKKRKTFKFPMALLHQVNECSKAFVLITVSENDTFEVFQNIDNPVQQLALSQVLMTISQTMSDVSFAQADSKGKKIDEEPPESEA